MSPAGPRCTVRDPNGVDDNGNGLLDESGFSVVFEGSLATVRLTLVRRDQAGFLVEHEMVRTIALRNTEVTP